MTGFGRGEAAGRGRVFTVEVQSVNHRFLEVRCRVPKHLTGLEPRIQQAIQQRFFQIVKGEAPDTHGWLQPVTVREAATSGAAKSR